MAGTGETVVLVADDERSVAETFAAALDAAGGYETRIADGGEAAVERMDESVDVALLDRRMPGFSGDRVLAHVREVGYDCAVGMVTAVTPTTDAADLPFDLYLVKPLTTDEVVDAVETLARVRTYEDAVREEFVLARKRALLRHHLPRSEWETSDAVARLRDRYDDARAQTDRAIDALDAGDVRRTLDRLSSD